MCGIVGYTGPEIPELLPKLCRLMFHRGPDAEGYYQDQELHLGMRRLAILDPSGGMQPMHSPDQSITVICNGEIYNYLELREELEQLGYEFYTKNSDTEVLPQLYKHYGPEFIHKLNGMYAIAIYDHPKNTIFLFRDPIGEKPLYYSIDNENKRLIFASEFNVLRYYWKYTKPDESTPLKQSSLQYFFANKTMPTGCSIDKRINTLAPGTVLKFKDSSDYTTSNYFNINRNNINYDATLEDRIQELDDLIDSAVQLRLRSDVEVGAFLSGGVDSSLIVTLANKYSSQQLRTYSLVYEQDVYGKKADQSWAKHIAESVSSIHTEVILTPELFIEEIPKIVKQYGQPNSVSYANWFVSKRMAKDLRVTLSGDGADELFGSYFLHRISAAIDRLQTENDASFLSSMRVDEQEFIKANSDHNIQTWLQQFAVFSPEDQRKLFTNYREQQVNTTLTKTNSALNDILYNDCTHFLPEQILNYTDLLSMAHSLELRVPFLDPRIIEFAFSLPGEFKIHRGETKYILKRVAERHLPKDLVYRPKEGFIEPNILWLQSELKDFTETYLLSENFNRLGFLNSSYVKDIFDEFYKSKDFYIGKKLWTILMFAVWEQQCEFE